MQFNMHMEGASKDGSEGASCSSDDGQFVVALIRKMLEREMEVMVIRTVQRFIGPFIGDLFRKVVKEEILPALEKFLSCETRNQTNEMTNPRERSLTLKFIDEISGPVLTGKVIEGKSGIQVQVALVDKTTGKIVDCGPESSAKVEILVLDASGDDNRSLSVEDFNKRIIRESDKEKPRFAKSNYIYLVKGVGVLQNAKLGHDAKWMKSCKCQLGARIVGNFRGINVEEASSESFMVSDSRSKLYEKHYPPFLSDRVWRLENIGKDGAPYKRLNKNNIFTVQDFLFLLSIDPQRLEKIVSAGAKWKSIVDHARTCVIDDKKIRVYYPASENKMGVSFDVVGGLKGLIHDTHYVPVNNLSDNEKDCAHKLLLSAFENPNDITSFDDENSLLHQFPLGQSDVDAATNLGSNGSDLVIPGNNEGQLYDYPYRIFSPDQTHSPSELDRILEHWNGPYGDDNPTSLLSLEPTYNSLSGNLLNSHEHFVNVGRSNLIEVAAVMLRVVRASKRFLALGGIHVQKRQRI